MKASQISSEINIYIGLIHTTVMKKAAIGKKLLLIFLFVVLGLAVTAGTVFAGIYFSAKLDKDAVIAERAQVVFFDKNGNQTDYSSLARYVNYEDINSNIINSFVALEDKRFFNHGGVDFYRTAGALINNLKAGRYKEGGSTITQQLAKNTMLSSEKTIVRKIKEMKLARDIEKNYTKEQILEMYLNAIYFGNGVYGIDSACKYYYDKAPSEIGIAESAILAGIVKSPQNYSPVNNPDKCYERMRLVLRLLKEQGYISESEYEKECDYVYVKPEKDGYSPYFANVISQAADELGISEIELIKSPYSIYTYYDQVIQKKIEALLAGGDYYAECINGQNAYTSVVVADNVTGGINAFYSNKKYDVFTLRRQPGSAIKPIAVYSPALNSYMITPADLVIDEPKDFDGYRPKNYGDVYLGATDVETAVKKSINTVAVEIYNKMNRQYCLDFINKCGITTEKEDGDLALSLGGMTKGTTPVELCEAYLCLANGGYHNDCGFIKEIRDEKNRIIFRKNDVKEKVMNEDAAFLMTDMLIKTTIDGTAKKLSVLPFPIAAKTGTVNGSNGNNSDAWCVSYNDNYTLCVWYGGEDLQPENNVTATGGGLPAMVSAEIYKLLPMTPCVKKITSAPANVVELETDLYARQSDGKVCLVNPLTPSYYRKSYNFSIKNAPEEYSPYFVLPEQVFSAEVIDGEIILKFTYNPQFEYRIYRSGIADDDVLIYSTAGNQNNTVTTVTYCDKYVDRKKIYVYSLEVYFEGKKISTDGIRTVIT